jgi:hypothetical protein
MVPLVFWAARSLSHSPHWETVPTSVSLPTSFSDIFFFLSAPCVDCRAARVVRLPQSRNTTDNALKNALFWFRCFSVSVFVRCIYTLLRGAV